MKASVKSTGIKIPPPVFYIIGLLLGLGIDYFFHNRLLPVYGQYIGQAFLLFSLFNIVFVLIKYKKAKTPFNALKPAKVLVTGGPNKYSRNPGYLALTLLYLGIGFTIDNIWVIALSIPIIIIMNVFIIKKEEQHLEALFGEEYLRYKSSVRRWL